MIVRAVIAAVFGAVVLNTSIAPAQDWPSKPVRIITG